MDSLKDKKGPKKKGGNLKILFHQMGMVDLALLGVGCVWTKSRAFTFGWHPATSTTNLSWPIPPFGLYGIYLNSFLFHWAHHLMSTLLRKKTYCQKRITYSWGIKRGKGKKKLIPKTVIEFGSCLFFHFIDKKRSHEEKTLTSPNSKVGL
jgi:hypothetical protein